MFSMLICLNDWNDVMTRRYIHLSAGELTYRVNLFAIITHLHTMMHIYNSLTFGRLKSPFVLLALFYHGSDDKDN